jgi:leukotriene-A4 hydrolase
MCFICCSGFELKNTCIFCHFGLKLVLYVLRIFLWNVQIGRPAFDEFLKKYIATFKFKSIDTETFLDFLKANIPGIENQIDLVLWTEGTGIPSDAYEPDSSVYKTIVSLANEFVNGRMPGEDEIAEWQGQEWELYLDNLPKSVEASQVYYFHNFLLTFLFPL